MTRGRQIQEPARLAASVRRVLFIVGVDLVLGDRQDSPGFRVHVNVADRLVGNDFDIENPAFGAFLEFRFRRSCAGFRLRDSHGFAQLNSRLFQLQGNVFGLLGTGSTAGRQAHGGGHRHGLQ